MENETTKENAVATNGTTEVAIPGPGEIFEIKLDGDTTLEVVSPEISKMLADPSNKNADQISSLLALCVVPIYMNVFNIPEMLIERAVQAANEREEMLPPDIIEIKREIAIFNALVGHASSFLAVGGGGKDLLTMFTYAGVANAREKVDGYLNALRAFCGSMADIEKEYASQDAFFRKEALGVKDEDVVVPVPVIVNAISTFKIAVNKLVAGEGGYEIMALVKSIDRISNFLDNKTVMSLFGAQSKLDMLNKLKFRIMPEQITFSQNLVNLVNRLYSFNAEEAKGENGRKILAGLLLLSTQVSNGMKTLR